MKVLDPNALYERAAQAWLPPEKLTLTEWAERNLFLDGSQPGLWRRDFAPYQAGILDALADPNIEKVTLLAGSQTGKTTLSQIIIGYFIDHDPSPILYIRESKDKASEFANREMVALQAVPKLKDLLGNERDRNRKKGRARTKLKKYFPGGYLILTGSESAASLAGLSCRVVICDEISKFKPIPGFGNPINLAESRTNAYTDIGTRKMVFISVPGELNSEGETHSGSIEELYQQGDQRHFEVPCPHCGALQDLKFENVIFQHCRETLDSIFYKCQHCSGHIYQAELRHAVRNGQWVSHSTPSAENRGHASFRVSGLHSPFLNMKEIVKRFLQTKNSPDALRVFLNDTLGESWVDREFEALSSNELMKRRVDMGDKIPLGVGLLTISADTQDDRLEATIIGWGRAQRSWVISHRVYMGSPAEQGVWDQLYADYKKAYDHESGETIRPSRLFIDSQGHHTDAVHRFVHGRHTEGIYPIEGSKEAGSPLLPRTFVRRGGRKVRQLVLGVTAAKDYLYSRIHIAEGEPGSITFSTELDEEYFKQLLAEKRTKKVVGGQVISKYKAIRARNEALDCYVYGLCAYEHHEKQKGNIDQLCDFYLERANSEFDGLTDETEETEQEGPVEDRPSTVDIPAQVIPAPPRSPQKWSQKRSRTALSW